MAGLNDAYSSRCLDHFFGAAEHPPRLPAAVHHIVASQIGARLRDKCPQAAAEARLVETSLLKQPTQFFSLTLYVTARPSVDIGLPGKQLLEVQVAELAQAK
jgi:hypothetical protein